MKRRWISKVGIVVCSLMLLLNAGVLSGLGCVLIHWFFWSQGTCGPDFGIGLLVGSFFVVYGKRSFVLAFQIAGPGASQASRRDLFVLAVVAALLAPSLGRPVLRAAAALTSEWARSVSRSTEGSGLKSNADQPSYDLYQRQR